MSPRALALSLALHAGLFALIGKLASDSTNAGPGDPGIGVSFAANGGSGLVLMEPAPAAPPDAGPELSIPEASPAALVIEPAAVVTTVQPAAPVLVAPAPRIPRELPPIADGRPAQKSRSKTASSTRGKSGEKPGASAKAGGNGVAEAGDSLGFGGGGGGGYTPPQFKIRYKPPYPEQARAQRLEGTVLLLVSVNESGRVTGASIRHSCGHVLLDRTALVAVRSWVGSSRVDLQACKLEYSIVSPK